MSRIAAFDGPLDITIHPNVAAKFPGTHLAFATMEDVRVHAASAEADALKREAEASARATRTADALKGDTLFRAYRDLYWALGIDPTKTRPTGEALNRRVLNGGKLPAINAFVDVEPRGEVRTSKARPARTTPRPSPRARASARTTSRA